MIAKINFAVFVITSSLYINSKFETRYLEKYLDI
jgi:hypothetical protein